MKARIGGYLVLGLAVFVMMSLNARSTRADKNRQGDDRSDGQHERDGDHHDQDCRVSDHHEENKNTPVNLIGVIPIPGAALTSVDIAWTDPGTERYYFADRNNASVDIVDAEDDVFVGRVTGFVGAVGANGTGPNGVLVTPDRKLWAGDGNSLAQVADVDPNSGSYLHILQPGGISTAIPACGTTCGRADELAYDPKDKIILIGNSGPTGAPPYATFIDAKFFKNRGFVSFPGAGGFEQPVWDAEKQRFLVTVPGSLNAAKTQVVVPASIHVINPVTMMDEKTYPLDCGALTDSPLNVSITGIALGPFQHILVSACGFPIVLTLNAATTTIHVLNVVSQVGGGDEVWFNPGDDRFYVTAALNGVTGQTQQLGVIDAEDGSFLQNVSELGLRGRNPAAFAENNHIFTIQSITTAIRDNMPAGTADDSVCATFGYSRTGCIAIFEHNETPDTAVADDSRHDR